MSLSKTFSLLASAALIARISAHGIVTGIVVDGVWHSGYNPNFQYQNPPPTVAGWSIPEDQDLGFVSNYSSPDIICHKAATPGGAYITVAAGDKVTLEWTNWPVSHHGPVMDYLASCSGDCTTVDKTKLLFNKIDEAGLINGSPAPGTWASDALIANNNSWTVTIPPTIAPGKYVLRHETIALHSAENLDGSQAYPQCINLDITGSGTNTLPTGTLAQKLYKDTDPGILVNIYYPALTNYTIPGPALIADAVSESQPSVSASASPAKSSLSTTPTTSYSAASTGKGPFPTTSPYLTPSSNSLPSSSVPGPRPSTHGGAISSPSTSAAAHQTYTTSSPSSTHTPTPSSVWTERSYSAAPTSTEAAPATTSSLTEKPWPPLPMSSAVSAAGTSPTTTTTVGISFTSTVTGRIGKPTKFTCYIDE